MSQEQTQEREKLTLVADRQLLQSIQDHRSRLAAATGLRVSKSGAAEHLIRTGLDAAKKLPLLPQ